MRLVNPTGKHGPKKRHHREGSIIERHDHWRAEPWLWTLRGTDSNGRRTVLASLSGTSEDDVRAKAKRELERIARGANRDALTLSVADMLERWLDSTRDSIRSSSFVRYRGTVRRLARDFDRVRLADLDAAGTRKRLVGSPHQRRTGLLVLRMALRQAVAERIIERDPTAGVKPPKTIVREAPTIDADAARRIIARVEGEPIGPLLILALTTGLRRGELLALRWSDVDGSSLVVRHALRRIPRDFRAKGERPTEIGEPKTTRSARRVPLPAIAEAALERQRERQKTAREAATIWAANDLVFADEHGQALWPGTVTMHAEKLLRTVVPGCRLHDLRHAWQTLLSSQGVTEVTRMALAGHATAAQTIAYTHPLGDDARAAAASLDRVLGG